MTQIPMHKHNENMLNISESDTQTSYLFLDLCD